MIRNCPHPHEQSFVATIWTAAIHRRFSFVFCPPLPTEK